MKKLIFLCLVFTLGFPLATAEKFAYNYLPPLEINVSSGNGSANLSGYWLSNGSSTATGNWDLEDYNLTAKEFLVGSSTGVKLNATDGVLTMQGMKSGGFGNLIDIDFEYATNAIGWSSPGNIFSFNVPFYAKRGLYMSDSSPIRIGHSGQDANFMWSLVGDDHLELAMKTNSSAQSGYFYIREYGSNLYPSDNVSDPTLRILATGTDQNDYIQFSHDGDDGLIKSGTGAISFDDDNITTSGDINAQDYYVQGTQFTNCMENMGVSEIHLYSVGDINLAPDRSIYGWMGTNGFLLDGYAGAGYFTGQVAADDFITNSAVADFSSEESSLDKLNNTDEWLKEDGSIDYLEHYAGLDYTQKVLTGYKNITEEKEYCYSVYEEVDGVVNENITKEICEIKQTIRKVPVYETQTKQGLSMETRVAEMEKMIKELHTELEIVKSEVCSVKLFSWCIVK
jgi:hypothetical protein